MVLQPEVQRALTNDASRQAVLSSLHSRIVHCHDPRTMADLLGRYTAAAFGRLVIGEDAQMQQLQLQDFSGKQSQIMQTISNLMKTWSDATRGVVRNTKS